MGRGGRSHCRKKRGVGGAIFLCFFRIILRVLMLSVKNVSDDLFIVKKG